MSENSLIPARAPSPDVVTLIETSLRGFAGNTKRAYTRHMEAFLVSGLPLSREGITRYLEYVPTPSGKAVASAAIKRLAETAHDHGALGEVELWSIQRSNSGVGAYKGIRLGRWLTKEQVQALYALPDRATLIGQRDAAIMALLLGCGLRREEATVITWQSYQEREGRMALVDFWGKGSKIRSVPVPTRARADIDAWQARLEELGCAEPSQSVLRRILGHSNVSEQLSPNGLWYIVSGYAKHMGLEFSPHDLRRSMARMMAKAHVPLKQIQEVLGHTSISTTERYISSLMEWEMGLAPTDALELGLSNQAEHM